MPSHRETFEGFIRVEGVDYWVSGADVYHDPGAPRSYASAGEPESWGLDGIEQLETELHDETTDAPVDMLPRYASDAVWADAVDRAILARVADDA